MYYKKVVQGQFHERLNRFVSEVWINGKLEAVHVKNTGRLIELLISGADVILEQSEQQKRKTKYDLVCVYKEKLGWVNIDSQAANKVVREWLEKQNYTYIKPEYTYGNSRIDFYMEKGESKYLMEVKGCTLEREGIGYFPDAPTERGIKHLHELTKAVKEGYNCSIAFVIQMEKIHEVHANIEMHREFGTALEEAEKAGVLVLFMECKVTRDSLQIWKCHKKSQGN